MALVIISHALEEEYGIQFTISELMDIAMADFVRRFWKRHAKKIFLLQKLSKLNLPIFLFL